MIYGYMGILMLLAVMAALMVLLRQAQKRLSTKSKTPDNADSVEKPRDRLIRRISWGILFGGSLFLAYKFFIGGPSVGITGLLFRMIYGLYLLFVIPILVVVQIRGSIFEKARLISGKARFVFLMAFGTVLFSLSGLNFFDVPSCIADLVKGPVTKVEEPISLRYERIRARDLYSAPSFTLMTKSEEEKDFDVTGIFDVYTHIDEILDIYHSFRVSRSDANVLAPLAELKGREKEIIAPDELMKRGDQIGYGEQDYDEGTRSQQKLKITYYPHSKVLISIQVVGAESKA